MIRWTSTHQHVGVIGCVVLGFLSHFPPKCACFDASFFHYWTYTMLVDMAPTFPLACKFENIKMHMFEDLLPQQISCTMLKPDTIATLMIYWLDFSKCVYLHLLSHACICIGNIFNFISYIVIRESKFITRSLICSCHSSFAWILNYLHYYS